jgi:hypothetical protein
MVSLDVYFMIEKVTKLSLITARLCWLMCEKANERLIGHKNGYMLESFIGNVL